MLTARQYHERTNHQRGALSGRALDWSCKPELFKNYPLKAGLSTLHMSRQPEFPAWDLAELVRHTVVKPAPLDQDTLSRLLALTYALTAEARHGSEAFHFRSAASAGALYPCEIYVALGPGVEGLGPGLYYYDIAEHGLTRLCAGDALARAQAATGVEGPLSAMVLISAIFQRSAWKYGNRAYRYAVLDAGHVAENLRLGCRSLELDGQLRYDFDDAAINSLLAVDPRREGCLVAMGLRAPSERWPGEVAPCDYAGQEELLIRSSRCSHREAEHPLLRDMHEVSSRVRATQPAVGQEMAGEPRSQGLSHGVWRSIPASGPAEALYPDVLFRRRSRRNFLVSPLSSDRVAGLLRLLGNPSTPSEAWGSLCAGLLLQNCEDLRDGYWLLDREQTRLAQVGAGGNVEASVPAMAMACLDQKWLGRANLHLVLTSNLSLLEERRGPRGYRHALLEAGRAGQRFYLAAMAMGLGACGIGACYDEEAAELLGLNRNSALVYLLAAGQPRSTSRPG